MEDNVRLVAFDLDGTLLRGDTVLEAIARPLGRLDRTRQFETLHRLKDIKAAREEVAGWYRLHSLPELTEHLRTMQVAPGVRRGFGLLKQRGIKVALVSITWEFAVEWWAGELGADFYVGTGLSRSGEITHFWPDDKPVWLARLAAQLGIPLRAVAAVGDSLSDMPMLDAVGHPFFVGRDKPQSGPERLRHHPGGDIGKVVEAIVDLPVK
jgi:phosphoserine phosphatase